MKSLLYYAALSHFYDHPQMMTPTLLTHNPTALEDNPLTRFSIAALADMGYNVNLCRGLEFAREDLIEGGCGNTCFLDEGTALTRRLGQETSPARKPRKLISPELNAYMMQYAETYFEENPDSGPVAIILRDENGNIFDRVIKPPRESESGDPDDEDEDEDEQQ